MHKETWQQNCNMKNQLFAVKTEFLWIYESKVPKREIFCFQRRRAEQIISFAY